MRRLLVALAPLVALALAAPSWGQTHLDETRRYSSEEFDKLTALSADTPTLDDKQKETIQVAVRWHVYRITSTTTHSTPGAMNTAVTNTEFLITKAYKKEKDKEAFTAPKVVRDQFAQEMLTAVKDKILGNPAQPPITQINSARVLAATAEASADETLIDALCALVNEAERIDAVKYYALKGINGALEALNRQQPPGVRDPKLSRKVRDTLIKFIERKSPLTARARADEIEGLRFIRREAVRALAQVRDPGSLKEETVALTLIRVMSGDGLDPDTRLDERLEAAIGVLRLDPKRNADYDPAYAAQHMAFFLSIFDRAYQNRKPGREPWKVHAARLRDALKAWENSPEALAKTIFKEGGRLLQEIEAGRTPQSQDYAKVLNFQPAGSVYKSDPKTAVTFPQ